MRGNDSTTLALAPLEPDTDWEGEHTISRCDSAGRPRPAHLQRLLQEVRRRATRDDQLDIVVLDLGRARGSEIKMIDPVHLSKPRGYLSGQWPRAIMMGPRRPALCFTIALAFSRIGSEYLG